MVSFLMSSLVVGFLSTVLFDGFQWLRFRLLGGKGLDYAHLGRLTIILLRGVKPPVAVLNCEKMPYERAFGWLLHYASGIGFAFLLLMIAGSTPHPIVTLVFGVATSLVPFLVLQPAMGLGFFADDAPVPYLVRKATLITHGLFGLALVIVMKLLVALELGFGFA